MAKSRRRASAPTNPRPNRTALVLAIVLALVVLDVWVYAPVRDFGFVALDDPWYVSENPNLVHGLTAESLGWAFTTGLTGNWHPVTWLSLLLDVSLFGVNAPAFHLVNVALHTLSTLLLFWLLFRTTRAPWASALVAAMFGVHPLHVESVAWISERKDVLSTCFMWLTMLAYVDYAERPGMRRYVLVMAGLAVGLMAKPMLVTVPVVLLLMDVWPLELLRLAPLDRAALKARVVEKLPLVGLVVVSSVVTFFVQRAGGAVSSLQVLPLDRRVINALASYVIYLGRMCWPTRLGMFYPFPSAPPMFLAIVGAVLLVLMSVMSVRLLRSAPYVAVGWFWYVITLLPVIGLVQIGVQSSADRYTYVPLVGIFIAMVWSASALAERWRPGRIAVPIAATAIVLACTAIARAQVSYWRDGVTAWERAIEVTPDNFVAHDALGSLLVGQGRLDDGIAHLKAALALVSSYPETYYNLGVALMKQGRTEEAESYLREALVRRPDFASAHANLGVLLVGKGRTDDAIREYRAAIAVEPAMADAHLNLGAALASKGDVGAGLEEFRQAARLAPDSVNAHYQLGLALAVTGRRDDAVREFKEVLRLDPNNPDAARALASIGRTY